MASLLGRAVKFARSPQGRRLAVQAKRVASDPQNRRRAADLRARLAKKR